jgi:ABC-type siderophore export system fused ATPase/permease subunit
MLTFTFYVRYIIEAYIILVLGSVDEIYLMNFGSAKSAISFVISVLIVGVLIFLLVWAFFMGKKASKEDFDMEKTNFGEIVEGTKNNKLGRLGMFAHLLRILISVVWIVCAQSCSTFTRIAGY